MLSWRTHKNSGFTLIELMIVVAIIGIIAAIAYPSYQRQVESTRRATAQADLLELAQFMERRYAENFSYEEDDDSAPALPFDQSPRGRDNPFYDIDFDSDNPVTSSTFVLEAVPTSIQSGDRCGTLTLNEAGVRGAADGEADCW